jgi:hypothetical protein
MGRWDNEGPGSYTGGGGWQGKKRRNYVRIAKFVIIIGFIVVATVVLTVFISRSGVNIEIIEQTEGAIQTISVRISNNNFDALRDGTVQFGEQGAVQNLGTMGPFSSVMVTPNQQDMNFDKIIVRGNDGGVSITKSRD